MRLAPERLGRYVPARLAEPLLQGADEDRTGELAWERAAVLAMEVRGLLPLVPTWAQRLAEHADDELGWVWRGALVPLIDGVVRAGGVVLLVEDTRIITAWPVPHDRLGAEDDPELEAELVEATTQAIETGLDLATRFRAHRPTAAHPVRVRLHMGLDVGRLRWGADEELGLWLGGPALEGALDAAAEQTLPGELGLAEAAADFMRRHGLGSLLQERRPLAEGHDKRPPRALANGAAILPAGELADLCSTLVREAMAEGKVRDPERLVRATLLHVRGHVAESEQDGLLAEVASLAREHHGLSRAPLMLPHSVHLRMLFGLTGEERQSPVDDAVRFALALRRTHPELGIGVATGPVFCGPLAAQARCGFVAAGPASARARALSRLPGVHMDRASEVEAGPTVSRAPGPELEGEASFVVAQLSAADEASLKAEAALFGRGPELQRLERALSALEGGISTVLFLEGEAGIGKTGLVEATGDLARARGWTTWVGGARPEGRSDPWHAWRGVAEALFDLAPLSRTSTRRDKVMGALSAEQRPLAPLLNPLLGLELTESEQTIALEGRARAQRVEDLLISLLESAAEAGPRVLVVEDAHWFDDASWSLALQVSQRVSPLFLLLTSRPLPDPPPRMALRLFDTLATTHWVLDALSTLGTRQLLGRALGLAEVPDELAAWVHERGQGNPFATQELAHALEEHGVIEVVDGALHSAPSRARLEALPLPPELTEVVAGRIARLPERQQALLGAASIIGPVFGLNALRDVHPIEAAGPSAEPDAELAQDLEDLRAADLALSAGEGDDGLFAFKHQITLEAAYAGMPSAQRRATHAALARHIEARDAGRLAPHYPALAHHWEQAGDLPVAIEYLEKAGEQAVRQGACTEAMAHLERARTLYRQARPDAVDRVRRARWARLLADAALGLGRMDVVSQHATEALVLLEQPLPRSRSARVGLLLWEAFRHLWLVPLWGVWSPSEGSPRRERLVEAALATVRLSRAQYFTLELLDFVTSCFRAVNLGSLAGKDAPVSSAYAMLGMLAGSLRVAPLGRFYLARADQIAVLLDDRGEQAFNHQLRALYHLGFGQWEESRDHASRALAGFALVSDRDGEQIGHTILGMVAFFGGHLDEASEHFNRLIGSSRLTGNRQHEAWGIYSVARIQALQGTLDEPVERLHSALDLLDGIEDPASRAICWATLALVHCRRGEWRRAQECAGRAGALCWEGQPSTVAVIDALWQMTEAHQRLLAHRSARGEAGQDVLEQAANKGIVALQRFSRMFPMGKPYLAVARARAAVLSGAPSAGTLVKEAMTASESAGAGHQLALAQVLQARLDPSSLEATRIALARCGMAGHIAELEAPEA